MSACPPVRPTSSSVRLAPSTVHACVLWFQPVVCSPCLWFLYHRRKGRQTYALPRKAHSGGGDPLFPGRAVLTDMPTAKPPPSCVEKELLQERKEEQQQQGRGSSVRWAEVRNTADGGRPGRIACIFPWLTAVSLPVQAHIVTPVTATKRQPPRPE